MEAAGAFRAAAPNLGLSWGQCGCHREPLVRPNSNSAEFRAWLVLNYSSPIVSPERDRLM